MTRDEMANYVVRFLEACDGGTLDDYRQANRDFLASDCVWENSGLPTAHGIDEIMAWIDAAEDLGVVRVESEIIDVTAGDDRVYVERIDHNRDAQGNDVIAPRIIGVFVFRDGRIVRWSDYYDPRPVLEKSAVAQNFAGG